MGIGMIVGGALKGYGDGMAEMARSREEERRERALISFRSERQKEQTQQQADLQDRNASRSDSRGDFYDSRQVERRTTQQVVVDKARTANDMTLEQMRQKNAEALARLNSSLNITEAQQASALRINEDAVKANTYIDRFETDDQGNLVGITATGKTIRPGVRPMPDAPKGNSSSLLTAPTAPAPARNVQQTSMPNIKKGDVMDGYRFNGGNAADPKSWTKVN
ncbi:MAG: hypothetical protein A2792_03365 [Sphingomonadales bacterium RIFCSPHIGHO2_01_FULL_65_20]|jgi:hypothetical protein|nr:MAG: hypothetical protein A2792_03365 [Sphingomonadales bacterium RIFCSPHIGHO2_01_FULL_65_20]